MFRLECILRYIKKMEQDTCVSFKLELELELQKRTQSQNELSEMLNENSNLKIREKQLTKQVQDLGEECNNFKLECENLRKFLIDSENYKIKSIQDECDELRQMNQLYRSQRLELGEENEALIKQCNKLKQDLFQLQKEKYSTIRATLECRNYNFVFLIIGIICHNYLNNKFQELKQNNQHII